ncbi:hypothetical protein MNB_SUP05-SYMBIONT-5-670 [hydrothermal vent metagenome]|uniref:Uncharacterized protein n=1 Tax=hydrothermal vent metagenome TaxID=652676 RepID=A0A1W1E5U8_9ZZZZ
MGVQSQVDFKSVKKLAQQLEEPLALLGVDLKNSKINKICHFANHPYLCKGL